MGGVAAGGQIRRGAQTGPARGGCQSVQVTMPAQGLFGMVGMLCRRLRAIGLRATTGGMQLSIGDWWLRGVIYRRGVRYYVFGDEFACGRIVVSSTTTCIGMSATREVDMLQA